MRGLLAGCLVLFIGPWIASGRADDPPAKSVAVPITVSTTSSEERLPRPDLGRPIALPAAPVPTPWSAGISDPKLTPVGFNIGAPRAIVRAQSGDSPQPLPMGPPTDFSTTSQADSTEKPVVLTQKPEVLSIAPKPVESIDQVVPSPGACTVVEGPCCEDDGECGNCWCGPLGWLRCRMPLRRLAWFILGDDGCCVNEPCRIWFDTEYLLWWTKNAPAPALVTASPPGTPPAQAGILGLDSTTVLAGGNMPLVDQRRSGARFTLGFWLDCERELALESTSLVLFDRQFAFAASGTAAGSAFLARPFVDAMTGLQAREPVAFPNLVSGTVGVTSSSSLWGTELNLRTNLCRSCCSRLDLLTGFRTLGLDENIHITENLQIVPEFGGTQFNIADIFGTHNNFYGGQLGLDWQCRRGRWTFDLLGKVALGDTHERIIIDGTTARTFGGVTEVQPGGLLALPTNIGAVNHDRFAVVPELGLKLGYQITPHIKFTVGYTFLYWSEVVRAGDQIDTTVNVTRIPFGTTPVGPARPAPLGKTNDFWAQGVNLGLEFKF